MTETLHKVQLDGNNNVVLQHVNAQDNITINTLDWDTFVQRYTYEQQTRIQELQKLLDRSEQLFDLQKLQLSQQINQLQAEKESIEAQVKRMIEEYADKDLRQTDALYRQAFELFLAGQLDDALAVLDDAKLEAELRKADEAKRQVAESYTLKADILQVQYKFKEAEDHLHRSLEISEQLVQINPQFYSPQLAATLNNLGFVKSTQDEFEAAEIAYLRALEIRRGLSKTNPRKYLSHELETLENLANLQFAIKKYKKAEGNYWQALEIHDKLGQDNFGVDSLNLSIILSGLIIIRNITNREIPENLLWRILKIQKDSANIMPLAYNLSVCETTLSLVNLYFKKIESQTSKEEDKKQFLTLLADVEARLQFYSHEIPKVQKMWNDVNHYKQFLSQEAG